MNDMTKAAAPDHARAMALHRRAEANLHSATVSLVEVGRCLKEMKEAHLYTELGFPSLEAYSEAKLGIKKSQAYKMIQISEKLPEDLVRSNGQLGIEKLALLALVAPEERGAVQERVDLEAVTVKELRAQIRQLEQERDAAKVKAVHSEALLGEKEKAWHRAQDRISMLTAKVEELEARPVEHAVQEIPDPEQQRKIEELTARLQQNEADYTQRIQTAQREHAERLREVQKELAKAQAAADTGPVPDSKAVFKAYLATAADALSRLMGFIESEKDDVNMPLFMSKVDAVIAMTKERRDAL